MERIQFGFDLKDDKTEENFKKELMELGATWMSGEKLEKHHRLSYYIAVHSDKTIAFISSMCWKMSFATNKEIVHVDYSSSRKNKFLKYILNTINKYNQYNINVNN